MSGGWGEQVGEYIMEFPAETDKRNNLYHKVQKELPGLIGWITPGTYKLPVI